MATLKALAVLPILVGFMAAVDLILFMLPIPGWIPVVMIVFQALYVVTVCGFLLICAALPNRKRTSEVETSA